MGLNKNLNTKCNEVNYHKAHVDIENGVIIKDAGESVSVESSIIS